MSNFSPRDFFDYNPLTGILRWKVFKGPRAKAGDVAGTESGPYLTVRVNGKNYGVHSVIWAWMTGVWAEEVDHRDLNKRNNVWANLREADRARNSANKAVRSDSLTGRKGVTWVESRGKWKARIKSGGVYRHLGYFENPEAAADAYAHAAKATFGDFARAA